MSNTCVWMLCVSEREQNTPANPLMNICMLEYMHIHPVLTHCTLSSQKHNAPLSPSLSLPQIRTNTILPLHTHCITHKRYNTNSREQTSSLHSPLFPPHMLTHSLSITQIHIYQHTHTHTITQSSAYARAHSLSVMKIHMYQHKHTHQHTHTHTHAHTETHAHARTPSRIALSPSHMQTYLRTRSLSRTLSHTVRLWGCELGRCFTKNMTPQQ
mmetsp:Transcript_12854/g.20400  ORF Transcript_12854/g.20400 Transcript_12854/m.20400 type:complete len:213 (-) Transcript_12854:409-1047(-)